MMLDSLSHVLEERLVAIVREKDPATALATARMLIAAGIRVIEVSLVTPGALDVIATLAQEAPTEVLVGAGTVLTAADVEAARTSGALFVVSPTGDPEMIRAALARDLLCIPGVATPAEALRVMQQGAPLQKLFPASQWTPGSMRDVLAALPQLRLVPTGGVKLDLAHEWIASGAVAVGMGSALVQGTPDQAKTRVAGLQQQLRDAR